MVSVCGSLQLTRGGPDSARLGVNGVTSIDLGLPGSGERFVSPSVQKKEALEKKAAFSTQREY